MRERAELNVIKQNAFVDHIYEFYVLPNSSYTTIRIGHLLHVPYANFKLILVSVDPERQTMM